MSCPSRPLDSVTLADEKKIPLVQDMESYLSKETKIFYASRGIPLRRGYLLHGPPGTGKSSFSAAIAGHFALDLFVVNLTTPGLDDKGLETLFDALPARCIVLLEDIDSAGIQREHIRQASKKASDEANSTDKACVTLSGLLNVLGGPSAGEERLLLMTTNKPNSLDAAMVRPGRIDMKVHLGYASTEVLATMFKHIFTRNSQECDDKHSAAHNQRMSGLANAFASSVPADMLSPAEVQGYLMIHRNDPEGAVQKAKEWAAELIEIRAHGNNVATPNDVSASDGDAVTDTENVDGPMDGVTERKSDNDLSDGEESDVESESSIDTPQSSRESA